MYVSQIWHANLPLSIQQFCEAFNEATRTVDVPYVVLYVDVFWHHRTWKPFLQWSYQLPRSAKDLNSELVRRIVQREIEDIDHYYVATRNDLHLRYTGDDIKRLPQHLPVLEGGKTLYIGMKNYAPVEPDGFVWRIGEFGDRTIYMDGNGIFGYGPTRLDCDLDGEFEYEGIRYRLSGEQILYGLHGDLFSALKYAIWD